MSQSSDISGSEAEDYGHVPTVSVALAVVYEAQKEPALGCSLHKARRQLSALQEMCFWTSALAMAVTSMTRAGTLPKRILEMIVACLRAVCARGVTLLLGVDR